MEDIVVLLVELVAKGNILVIPFIIAFLVIKDPMPLIQTLNAWKSSKTSTLELALTSKYIKGACRTLIEEKLEQRHFYLSTGLNVEKPVRKKVLEVYRFSAGRIKFQHFARISDSYLFDNSILSLKWGYYHYGALWLFGSVAFISLFSSMVLLVLILFTSVNNEVSLDSMEQPIPLVAFLIATGLFYLYCWITLDSTNIVRKEIAAFNKSNNKLNNDECSKVLSNF